MDITLELIQELTQNEKMMWVVGGGSVVSENNGTGIKPPEVRNGYDVLLRIRPGPALGDR